jgi:RHS repeat-associated protein
MAGKGKKVSAVSAVPSVTSQTYYYHFGPSGETKQLTDGNGNVTDNYSYTAYGVQTSFSGTTENPFRYGGSVGYYSDTASGNTGIILCTNRWYSPEMGRWLTRDPIGYAGGENLYEYCSGDPVNNTDEEGLQPPYPLGKTIWVDARTLHAGREALDVTRVNESYRLNVGGSRPPAITINTNGVIYDGNHRAYVAAHFGEKIECRVIGTPIQSQGLITTLKCFNGTPIWVRSPSAWSRVSMFFRSNFSKIGSIFKGPRSPGSGGGMGTAVTVAVGLDTLRQGVATVVPYRRRLEAVGRGDLSSEGEDGK